MKIIPIFFRENRTFNEYKNLLFLLKEFLIRPPWLTITYMYKIIDYWCCVVLIVTIVKMYLISESNLITEGDNSEDFFINTLPSSPPSDLECTTTFDSLELTWTYPSSGMFDDFSDASLYHFYYELNESKFKVSIFILIIFWFRNKKWKQNLFCLNDEWLIFDRSSTHIFI